MRFRGSELVVAAWSSVLAASMCEAAWYDEGPTNWVTLAWVRCQAEEYTGGDIPTCHSKLRYMTGKSEHYPFLAGKYFGVEVPQLMPIPDKWTDWQAGGGGCNQDVGAICKKRVVCTMKESRWSASAKYIDEMYTSSKSWENSLIYDGYITEKCTLCVPTECADASCANGQLSAPTLTAYGADHKVYHRPNCVDRACAPGTWLTCYSGKSCRYQVPSSYHVGSGEEGKRAWFDLNKYKAREKSDLNIVEAWPLPSGSCYPCNLANRKDHYGKNVETPPELFGGGFLSYRCPGGADAPAMCKVNMVTRVDNATGLSGDCMCKNGYYAVDGGGDECAMCPAGHYCRWEGFRPPVKLECPQDTYALEGSADCKPCNTAYQMCDRNMALRRCLPGEGGRFQGSDATCVPCALCKQVTKEAGSVPCYRVTSAFNDTGVGG